MNNNRQGINNQPPPKDQQQRNYQERRNTPYHYPYPPQQYPPYQHQYSGYPPQQMPISHYPPPYYYPPYHYPPPQQNSPQTPQKLYPQERQQKKDPRLNREIYKPKFQQRDSAHKNQNYGRCPDIQQTFERNSDRNKDYKNNNREQTYRNHDREQRYTKNNDKNEVDSVYSDRSSISQSQEEEVYYKKKIIAKRKDPVLDSKQEIKKWIEARRKNYPRSNQGERQKTNQEEMSILQKKIRKKIILINSDPRSIIKKQKDLDILRRFIMHPRKNRKIVTKIEPNTEQPLVQEITPSYIKPLLIDEKPNRPLTDELNKSQFDDQISPTKQIIPKEFPEKIQSEQQVENQEAVQKPINKSIIIQPVQRQTRQYRGRREQLSVDVIINHLQMKQREDSHTLQNLMDYKSNSFQYRYQYQTLETNLLLDNVFRDTSYMLQAIRYIVKNKFFQ